MYKTLLTKRVTGRVKAGQRLSPWDVVQIRKWVRTEGYGLGVDHLVRALHVKPQYNSVAFETLRNVVNNDSWYDPAYDRTVPLHIPADASPSFLTWLLL
jgi:hypothetical protein